MPSYPEKVATAIKISATLAVGVGSLAVAEKADPRATAEKTIIKSSELNRLNVNHLAEISMLDHAVHFVAVKKDKPVKYNLPHNSPSHTATSKHSTTIQAQSLPKPLKYIGACESTGSATAAINYKALNSSGAAGGFQIEPTTWDNFDGYPTAIDAPPAVQDKKAEELLAERGTEPWDSSEYCWGKYVNNQPNY